MKSTTNRRLFGLILVGSLVGCGNYPTSGKNTDPGADDESSGPNSVQAPDESAPLETYSDVKALAVINAANRYIDDFRKIGVDKAKEIYVSLLNSSGKDSSALKNMNDETITDRWEETYTIGTANKASYRAQENTDWNEYYKCPLQAPEESQKKLSNQCSDIAKQAKQAYEQAIPELNEQAEEKINQDFADPDGTYVQDVKSKLSTKDVGTAKKFILDWAKQSIAFSQDMARIAFVDKLRDEAVCDNVVNQNNACYQTGVKNAEVITTSKQYFNGNQSAWEYVQFLLQTRQCGLNLVTTINQIQTTLLTKRQDFITTEHMCVGYDFNRDNSSYQNCNGGQNLQNGTTLQNRFTGLQEGIRNEVSKMEVVLRRISVPCQPPGEPLVIDLDGDGVTMSADLVDFDVFATGSKARTQWVGAREGLVAFDRDGNGKIDSTAELMGDRTDCGDSTCLDGVAALRTFDTNGDGVLNDKDASFARLVVWTDRNQDGESQAEEIAPLFSYGVTSISFDSATLDRTGLNRLEVRTNAGLLYAYDVYFHVKTNMQNLSYGFGPRK